MQFYAAIGITVALAGARGLWLIPAASVGVTLMRVVNHEPITIVTWLRIDEILAGGTLALLLHTYNIAARRWLGRVPFLLVGSVFLFSAAKSDALLALNYLRPYLAATMVGVTIVRPVPLLTPLLTNRTARYMAAISYALYIFHPYSMSGWLGSGEKLEKYAKRPLCLALTFAAAHLSTFFFEKPINRWAHRITASRDKTKWA